MVAEDNAVHEDVMEDDNEIELNMLTIAMMRTTLSFEDLKIF